MYGTTLDEMIIRIDFHQFICSLYTFLFCWQLWQDQG